MHNVRIEHIAAYVQDLENSKKFFCDFFGAIPGPKYEHKEIGFSSYFLEFGSGARLELMHKDGVTEAAQSNDHLGFIHMAISVGSKEAVNELTRKLSKAGFKTVSGPRITGDGYYESCVSGPENMLLEITV